MPTQRSNPKRHIEALTKDRDHWKNRCAEKEKALQEVEYEYRRWIWKNPDKAPPYVSVKEKEQDRWAEVRGHLKERLVWLGHITVSDSSINEQIEKHVGKIKEDLERRRKRGEI